MVGGVGRLTRRAALVESGGDEGRGRNTISPLAGAKALEEAVGSTVRRYRNARGGGITFVQRFGSALNLNPHLHILVLDGVTCPFRLRPATFVAVPPDSARFRWA